MPLIPYLLNQNSTFTYCGWYKERSAFIDPSSARTKSLGIEGISSRTCCRLGKVCTRPVCVTLCVTGRQLWSVLLYGQLSVFKQYVCFGTKFVLHNSNKGLNSLLRSQKLHCGVLIILFVCRIESFKRVLSSSWGDKGLFLGNTDMLRIQYLMAMRLAE